MKKSPGGIGASRRGLVETLGTPTLATVELDVM